MKRFDLLVIGGGSGGVATANRAASYGAKVALFEPGRMGGTCVNVGCVPKKIMWSAASLAHAVEEAAGYGILAANSGLDWSTLKRNRDDYIRQLKAGYERGLTRNKVEIVRAFARFAASKVLEADGERYTADHIVIAVGGRPIVPELPGAELGITSDGFFELERKPERVALVGAGYVAAEFGGLLQALGSEVTLLLRRDHFLHDFDSTLRDALMQQMLADGVRVIRRVKITDLSGTPGAVQIGLDNG
ncbi:MAG: FAD-dependent oxidoreductase, partial [Burkholderiales bacterium]